MSHGLTLIIMIQYNKLDLQYTLWNHHLQNLLFSIFFFDLFMYPKHDLRPVNFYVNDLFIYTQDFKSYNFFWKNFQYFYPFELNITQFNFKICADQSNSIALKTSLKLQQELTFLQNVFVKKQQKPVISLYTSYTIQASILQQYRQNFYRYFPIRVALKYKILTYCLLKYRKHPS